jgi:hypothetical protein
MVSQSDAELGVGDFLLVAGSVAPAVKAAVAA